MFSLVDGQESGGLGKAIAGEKHDLDEKGKQVAALEKKMRVDGQMAPIRIRISTKSVDKSHQDKPGYIPVSERAEMHQTTTSKGPYEGYHYHIHKCVCNTEEGCPDPLSIWESDPLCKMFLDWANKEGKTYQSAEERKFRFNIWCSKKKMLEHHYSNLPGHTFSINKMNMFADMTPSESKKMHGACIERDPHKGRPPPQVVKLLDTLGKEGVNKAWKEFDEWAKRHKRDYGSREERIKRFYAYLDNKRRIDMTEERLPGFRRNGYDKDNMDKFIWEAKLGPKTARCPRCGG